MLHRHLELHRKAEQCETEHSKEPRDQSVQAFTSIMSSPFSLSVSGLPLAKASCTFSLARRIWVAVSVSRACLAEAFFPACLVRRCSFLRVRADKSWWQAHGRRLQAEELEGLSTVSVVSSACMVTGGSSLKQQGGNSGLVNSNDDRYMRVNRAVPVVCKNVK